MVTDTKQRQNLRSIAKRNGYQFRTVKTRWRMLHLFLC
jgi:hypothetical protein